MRFPHGSVVKHTKSDFEGIVAREQSNPSDYLQAGQRLNIGSALVLNLETGEVRRILDSHLELVE